MKYIIMGLGRFGSAFCEQFSQQGHEVIAVDKDLDKIEEIKDKVESAICLDSCDIQALRSLPLGDCDGVFVTMGNDFGNSIYTIALLKQLGVKHIVGRALSAIHKEIMQAIGITEIIMPEAEYAQSYVHKVLIPHAIGAYPFSDQYQVFELPVPHSLIGQPVDQEALENRYDIRLLAIKRKSKSKLQQLLSSHTKIITNVSASAELVYEEYDSLLFFAELSGLRKLYPHQ